MKAIVSAIGGGEGEKMISRCVLKNLRKISDKLELNREYFPHSKILTPQNLRYCKSLSFTRGFNASAHTKNPSILATSRTLAAAKNLCRTLSAPP